MTCPAQVQFKFGLLFLSFLVMPSITLSIPPLGTLNTVEQVECIEHILVFSVIMENYFS